MKAYLITTAVIFGLITVAHLWRAIAEGARVAADPVYHLLTLAAAALCFWACRLLRQIRRQGPG